MNPSLRNGIIIAVGAIVATAGGWQIANESLLLTGALGGSLLLWLGSRATGVPIDALIGGLVIAGYLIGNRGFAQLNVPNIPLLPGEAALAVGILSATWTAAISKQLPIRRDALNLVLIAWLCFGVCRLGADVPAHGIVALRDFAILYYASFFFLAQAWWEEPIKRRWIEGCLTVGFTVGAPTFLAFARWPDFFVDHFSIHGVPLIYVKSDVQGGLLVAGTFWFLHRYVATGRPGWLLPAALNLLGVALSNSRAALVAFAGACVWLALYRDWRSLRPILVMGAMGLAGLFVAASLNQSDWKESLAYRFYESVASIGDVQGARSYDTADLADKPDNNLFRLAWWRAVLVETWADGRWLGLGFGYDLSGQFTRSYYFDNSDEFRARSPHNFPLTVFGRMGLVGLSILLICLGIMAARTRHAGRIAADAALPTAEFMVWVGAWGIFFSACFGVVLEGPMGASIFWTLLGLANAAALDRSTSESDRTIGAGPDLPRAPDKTELPRLRTAP